MRHSSNRPHAFRDGSVGYWHSATNHSPSQHRPIPKKDKVQHLTTDACEELLRRSQKRTTPDQMNRLASQLGVRVSALMEMRVAFGTWTEYKDDQKREYSAWLFPMRDGHGNLVGFRARDWHGNKWAVTGSRNGLFYPYVQPEDELWIPEGATDTAALRSLNLYAVGRFSCNGGMMDLKTLVTIQKTKRCYIVADNDKPGIEGAESLARHLQAPCCIVVLPTKDVREAVQAGATYETLMCFSTNTIWNQPTQTL